MAAVRFNIWTDGSCNNRGVDREGGWAFLVEKNGEFHHENVGIEDKTTSSRMEMEAVYQALKYAKKNISNSEIFIHSDSAYVVNCFLEKWYLRWIEMDYQSVKNTDKWRKILSLMNKNNNKVKFVKVKGHAGIEQNERCDYLAGVARKMLIEQKCQLKK